MDTLLQRVDSGSGVLTVVGADGNGVQLQGLVVQHFLVGGVIGLNALHAVLLEESGGLAGDEVGTGHDLYVSHALVGIHVRVCDPAATDDTYTHLSVGVNDVFYLLTCVVKKGVHFFFCHDKILLYQKNFKIYLHSAGAVAYMGNYSIPSTINTPQY